MEELSDGMSLDTLSSANMQRAIQMEFRVDQMDHMVEGMDAEDHAGEPENAVRARTLVRQMRMLFEQREQIRYVIPPNLANEEIHVLQAELRTQRDEHAQNLIRVQAELGQHMGIIVAHSRR